jgi:flagellar hook protein FlgE
MSGNAFFSAITGMKSNQTRLDVIANNIANLNTFGFKASRVTFSDLLNQMMSSASSPQGQRGGINPMQIGMGVRLASIDTLMGQGSIQNTGKNTDLAINGDGFFIVQSELGPRYTRTGNFIFDYNGTLLNPDGLRVQGYNTLTTDGMSVDTNAEIGDIQLNFGEKLAARATSLIGFRSNLDAGSNVFGTAELNTVGTTGFTLAAGTMLPIATAVGTAVDDGSGTPLADSVAGNGDLVINGQEITYAWPVGWAWGNASNNAQFIVNAINDQSTTVYAYVDSGNNIVVQSMFGGEENDVIIEGNTTTPGFLATIGLTDGTFVAPEPSSALSGLCEITVVDATQTSATTINPVQAGALVSDTFFINDVSITFPDTDATNTAAENAQIVANSINSAVGLNVTATGNANGTITLTSDMTGASNIIAIENEGTALGILGLDSVGTLTTNPFPIAPGTALTAYVIDNGTDATITSTFKSDDGLTEWTRRFADSPVYGIASSLEALEPYILGDNPALPLLPGVTLTADGIRPGQASIKTNDAFEHITSINVLDSLGAPHFLTVTYRHTGENTWEWFADLPEEPNLSLTGATGTIQFDSNGMITSPNPTTPIGFTPAGAELMQVKLVYDGSGDQLAGITQFGSATTTRADYQDGFSMGILQTVAFDVNGVLHGSFSNGQVRPLAQIALANFNNPAGLERSGYNTFATSANSGMPYISTALSGGAGSIVPSALEQSNVDLASEFTDMIISQRGFQANTRVISTQNDILAEAVNLVR